MNKILFDNILALAKPFYPDSDPAHDWGHICRVFAYAHKIWLGEGGDLDIITAGVFFHDCVNLPKNHPNSSDSATMSAERAVKILSGLNDFPQHKLPAVAAGITEHSFSKGLKPSSLESKIIQDADRLESTGIIAIMRVLTVCGQLGRPIFNWQDPFCEDREPEMKYGLDLVYSRILKVSSMMNTETARGIAVESDERTRQFIALLKSEAALFPTEEDHWDDKLEVSSKLVTPMLPPSGFDKTGDDRRFSRSTL